MVGEPSKTKYLYIEERGNLRLFSFDLAGAVNFVTSPPRGMPSQEAAEKLDSRLFLGRARVPEVAEKLDARALCGRARVSQVAEKLDHVAVLGRARLPVVP